MPTIEGGESVCALVLVSLPHQTIQIRVFVFGPKGNKRDKHRPSEPSGGEDLGFPLIPPRPWGLRPWLTTTHPWHNLPDSGHLLPDLSTYLQQVNARPWPSCNSMANALAVVPRGLGTQCPFALASALLFPFLDRTHSPDLGTADDPFSGEPRFPTRKLTTEHILSTHSWGQRAEL